MMRQRLRQALAVAFGTILVVSMVSVPGLVPAPAEPAAAATPNLEYTGNSTDVTSEVTYPEATHYSNKGYWWVANKTGGVHKYNSTWGYTGVSDGLVSGVDKLEDMYQGSNGNWYVLDGDAILYKFNSTWGLQKKYNLSSEMSSAQGLSREPDGDWLVLSAQNTNNVYRYSESWSYTGESYDVGDIDSTMEDIYTTTGGTDWLIGNNGDNAYRLQDWDAAQSYDVSGQTTDPRGLTRGPDGNWFVTGGSSGSEKIYEYKGYDTVSGQVVNQDGVGVANATVAMWAVNKSVLDAGETAEDYFQKLLNRTPTSWDPNKALASGSDALFKQAETKYVAVTTGEASGEAWFDSADLSPPAIQVPANEEVVMTIWDPAQSSVLNRIDEYDSQLPGEAVSSGTIVVKPLGAGGDALGDHTYELTKTVGGGVFDPSSLSYAEVELPPGYYRIYPKGHPETGYVIKAGSSRQILQSFGPNVSTINDTLSQAAKRVQDALDKGNVKRFYTTTNASGHFSQATPSNWVEVAVQPMKAGGLLNASDKPTVSDMRTLAQQNDYNGSYILPRTPKIVDSPATGVTVRVTEISVTPHTGLGRFKNLTAWFQNRLQNLSYSDLPAALQQRLNSTSKETLVNTYNQRLDIVRSVPALEERARKNLADGEDLVITNPDDAKRSELTKRIEAMEQALASYRATTQVQESTGSVTTQTDGPALIDRTWIVTGEVPNPESVSVIAHYTNGTSEVVNDSYISVSQSFNADVSSQQETRIALRDFPFADSGAAGVTFELRAATNSGKVAHDTTRPTKNPAFDGELPSLKAIEMSSLNPGPNETVSVSLHPGSDQVITDIQSITAYGPAGNTVPSSVTGPKTATFTTSGQGIHHIRAVVKTASGKNMTISWQVAAAKEDYEMPAGIRAKSSPYGIFALVGDGLASGDVEMKRGGSKATFVARGPADQDFPSKVHLYTTGVSLDPDNTLTFRATQGSSDQAVSKHIRVVAHVQALGEDALVYRNGEPFARDGSKFGSINTNGSTTVIKTFTSDDGTVKIRAVANPGIIEEIRYQVDARVPDDISVSSLIGTMTAPMEAAV